MSADLVSISFPVDRPDGDEAMLTVSFNGDYMKFMIDGERLFITGWSIINKLQELCNFYDKS